MYPKAELLFPPRLIPSLRGLRGLVWAQLVDQVTALPENHPGSLAFTLLMIRLDDCVKCHEGSFKYMRGCHLCASQTVTQYKGADEDLILLYQQAQGDVEAYLSGERVVVIEEEVLEPVEE